jgi:hypothetical protein
MMKTIALICLLLLPLSAAGADSMIPDNDFYPGWEKSDDLLTFVKNDLYGHINGGAELFHEFGFDKLLVQRYDKSGAEIDLEVYVMSSPESALGIYLMKCGRETPLEGITARNTGNKSQFTIVKNRYFILVNSFQADSTLLPVMNALAQKTLSLIAEGEPVTLLSQLPPDNLVAGSERLIRGPFALQPIFTFGEGDILRLGGKVFGLVADYTGGNDSIYTRIMIPYQDRATAQAAYGHLVDNLDSYLTILRKRASGFAFEDYRKKYGLVSLSDNVLDIKVNLSTPPKDR